MTNDQHQGRSRSETQNPSKPKHPKGRRQYHKDEPSDKPKLVNTSTLRALQNEAVDRGILRLTIPTITLPPSFFSLFISLRVLDLRNVGLRRLPSQIIELKSLERLDLRYNNLTYLPSQLAELPNLADLQLDDLRDRKTGLLKDLDKCMPVEESDQTCSCIANPHGPFVPPLPTLIQLCIRAVLSSIPPLAADHTGGLSWEELEPLYPFGGRLEEETVLSHLSFAHVLPKTIPFDICSVCSEPVYPAHAQFHKIQRVALRRVCLQYILCSHHCYTTLADRWTHEVRDSEAKRAERELRFRVKQHDLISR